MHTLSVNEILDNISLSPPEDQSFIADTLNRRLHDLMRNRIADRGVEAQSNYNQGKVSSGSVTDLMKVLGFNDR